MTGLEWIILGILISVAIAWLAVVVFLIGRQNGRVDELMRHVERDGLA